jgi:hypothetical protein
MREKKADWKREKNENLRLEKEKCKKSVEIGGKNKYIQCYSMHPPVTPRTPLSVFFAEAFFCQITSWAPPTTPCAPICFFVKINFFFAGLDLGLSPESLTAPLCFFLFASLFTLFYFLIFYFFIILFNYCDLECI